jgi:hypothetical protein
MIVACVRKVGGIGAKRKRQNVPTQRSGAKTRTTNRQESETESDIPALLDCQSILITFLDRSKVVE